mmetsp:Transcript_13698/g.34885  ORF Transcript_13698/g.34885 Transcript_13698/m.34885 type:complete len:293 (-) Transcript_13698:1267-2145(-)
MAHSLARAHSHRTQVVPSCSGQKCRSTSICPPGAAQEQAVLPLLAVALRVGDDKGRLLHHVDLPALQPTHLDERLQRHLVPREEGSPRALHLLDQHAHAHALGVGHFDQFEEGLCRGSTGEEVVHDQDSVARAQVLLRDDELVHRALGVRAVGDGERVGDGQWPLLARKDHGDLEVPTDKYRGYQAGRLDGEDLVGHGSLEPHRQLLSARLDQAHVDLVVDERGDLENARVQHLPVAQHALAQHLCAGHLLTRPALLTGEHHLPRAAFLHIGACERERKLLGELLEKVVKGR